MCAGLGIDLPDHGPIDLHLQAALGDIAVRADTHIQEAAIRADGQRLGPMVVDFGRQVGDLGWRAVGLGLAFLVVKAHQRILVGYIQLAVGIGQAVRCVEVIRKHGLYLVVAIAISIAQQGQAVATLDLGIALGLDLAGDHILGLELGRAASPALSHQNVAIGQHQALARDFQAGGNGGDTEALRHGRFQFAPGSRLRNLHARQQAALRLRQLRVRAMGLGRLAVATTGTQQ
ncbi:hypothetical protein D3C80_1277480 [compost metagenome]